MKSEALLELVCEMVKNKKSEDGCYSDHPFEVGKSYFIRTVTYHFIGKVKDIVGDFLILSEASWVADSGRFHEALEKGTLSEIEYMDEAFVNIKTITDATIWKNKTPRESK